MQNNHYTLVAGHVTDYQAITGASHATLLIKAGDCFISASINVRSHIPPHTLLCATGNVATQLVHMLRALPCGTHELCDNARELSLDYVRDYLVERASSVRIPYRLDDSANPVLHWLRHHFSHQNSPLPGTKVYLWGHLERSSGDGSRQSPWRLHNIHMNQGSQGSHRQENGVGGDGGVVAFPGEGTPQALYLAFASQSWDTDDRRGHAIGLSLPDSVIETDAVVRIVAALLAPAEEAKNSVRPSITLINRSDQQVNLNEWRFEDHEGHRQTLKGYVIAAGECLRVPLETERLTLRQQGGVVRLFAAQDCLVHEVSYRPNQPLGQGWSVLFKS